jgi:hypothetical protein
VTQRRVVIDEEDFVTSRHAISRACQKGFDSHPRPPIGPATD